MLVATATAVFPISASGTVASAPPTAVHQVTPLDSHGHVRAPYSVVAVHPGYCWTYSFENGYLYRCFQSNYIHDPCWKESGRYSVVCLVLPWSHHLVRLNLTRHLPGRGKPSSALWGLRLGDGLGLPCLVSTGAGGWIGHHHISYYCRNGWVLVDTPDRRPAAWTILTAKKVGDHYQLRGRKTLTDAWRPIVG